MGRLCTPGQSLGVKGAGLGWGTGLGCWPESRVRERAAGNGGGSAAGQSAPHLGGEGDGAEGERCWGSQGEAAPPGLLPTLACLFLLLLKLVPSPRKHLLAWMVWLKSEASIQTQLQPLESLRSPCQGTAAAPLSCGIRRLARQPRYRQQHHWDTAIRATAASDPTVVKKGRLKGLERKGKHAWQRITPGNKRNLNLLGTRCL